MPRGNTNFATFLVGSVFALICFVLFPVVLVIVVVVVVVVVVVIVVVAVALVMFLLLDLQIRMYLKYKLSKLQLIFSSFHKTLLDPETL